MMFSEEFEKKLNRCMLYLQGMLFLATDIKMWSLTSLSTTSQKYGPAEINHCLGMKMQF